MTTEKLSTLKLVSEDAIMGVVLSLGVLIGLVLAGSADDTGMAFHAWVFAGASLAGLFYLIKKHYDRTEEDTSGYNDAIIKAGCIATTFWGLAGFGRHIHIYFFQMIGTVMAGNTCGYVCHCN